MGSRNDDPLELGGLDPQVIQAKIDKRDNKTKEPSQLEAQKEARLAEKEKRLSAGLTQKKGPSAPSEPPPVAPPPSKEDKTYLLDKLWSPTTHRAPTTMSAVGANSSEASIGRHHSGTGPIDHMYD